MGKLAEVGFAMGRHYLQVAGITLAVEGDKCRSMEIPEEILPPIPEEELEHAYIGGRPAKEIARSTIRFFRGDCWTQKMLQWAADKINASRE